MKIGNKVKWASDTRGPSRISLNITISRSIKNEGELLGLVFLIRKYNGNLICSSWIFLNVHLEYPLLRMCCFLFQISKWTISSSSNIVSIYLFFYLFSFIKSMPHQYLFPLYKEKGFLVSEMYSWSIILRKQRSGNSKIFYTCL